MNEISNNLTLATALKHFDFVDQDMLYLNVVGATEEDAQWLACVEPCTLNGLEIKVNDMLLIDRNNGQIRGFFHPIHTLEDNPA